MAKKSPLASDADGNVYVAVDHVMSPMVALIDGLPLTYFGRERRPYLKADVAIEWCRKEMDHHSRERFELTIEVLKRAMAQEERNAARTTS